MRLITKITLLYVFLMLVVFSIGGVVTYSMVKDVVRQETDYALRSETRLVVQSIEEGKPVNALQNAKITITEIGINIEEDRQGSIMDTMMMHRFFKTLEPFRKLSSTRKIAGKHYRITIADVFIEQRDMMKGVISTMVRLFIFLSLIFFLFSFFFSNKLLKPFHSILDGIKKFNIRNKGEFQLPVTNTTEFKELNHFLKEMAHKARKDYFSLKEFSENASHEMQTPLAIVKGKLELLQESPLLGEEELKLIGESQNSLSRLSKLGKSLVLITKIENQEYTQRSMVDISHLVNMSLESFHDLALLKKVSITKKIQDDVLLNIEEPLADIMVANLLKNAVQHNMENGWIHIELNKDRLLIRNSGLDPKVATEKLFDRFKKSNQTSESLGLGLSIVRQICDLNRYGLTYNYKDGVHEIVVIF